MRKSGKPSSRSTNSFPNTKSTFDWLALGGSASVRSLIAEVIRLNSNMTVEEFKRIYYYEWAHRNLGRFLGAAYTLPLLYFTARGYVKGPLRTRLYAIAVGIGLQVCSFLWFLV